VNFTLDQDAARSNILRSGSGAVWRHNIRIGIASQFAKMLMWKPPPAVPPSEATSLQAAANSHCIPIYPD